MKFYKIFIFLFCLLLMSFNLINAEEKEEIDISSWAFVMLTKGSDQDNNVKVSKYYNVDNNSLYAFCLQPNQDFLPIGSTYYKSINIDPKIVDIVKAYDAIGKNDNNYYIAAQLLIWQITNEIEYSFETYTYSEYKEELLNYISNNNDDEENIYKSHLNEIVTIEKDYSNYDVFTENIELIEINDKVFKYKVVDKEPKEKTIRFIPKNSISQDIIYESSTSQDLYTHFGPFLKSFNINVITLEEPEYIDIKYSKKDINGINISDAEFVLYEIDKENPYSELSLLKTNENIDLLNVLLDDNNEYKNFSIKLSERYEKYINNNYINTPELGYFTYKIYSNDELIKEGIVYVVSNIKDDLSFAKMPVKQVFRGYSEDLDVNIITNISKDKDYYLCESEPKNGYTYANEPCVFINGETYNNEIISFINNERTYSLRLLKQNYNNILLDGAIFLVKYIEEDKLKTIEFITGSLNIKREDNNNYLIYKKKNDEDICVVKFDGDNYINSNIEPGIYEYYQTNNTNIDENLFTNEIQVLNGGFMIDNLKYNSYLSVQEIKAPNGYLIDNNEYIIEPNLNYSDITFTNYRINEFEIIPPDRRFIIPKTCIDE